MKRVVWLLFIVLLASSVAAVGELTQSADRLNYFSSSLNHTVTISNAGSEIVATNTTLPGGWSFVTGVGCSLAASSIDCNLTAGGSASYTVSDPGSADVEYEVTSFPITANNSYSGNAVQFIRIQERELTHTLVEYGRGRGNYFFDSAFSGAGSGHTETGCNYVPNGTLFELNFLHKVLNVQQYFGNLSANAFNATFSCTYPNQTVIREHLISAIAINSSGAFVDYEISRIKGSWERMAFLSMDFAQDAYVVGQNISVNCSNLTYSFPVAGGNMVVDEDSFSLQVRDRDPFSAAASSSAIIGNGTQEVLITYNITNNELYTIDNVIIEIQAPLFANFVGTRAELWGVSRDVFRIEKSQLLPGESILTNLVARFDTSGVSGITSLNLTEGVKAQYVTCWELNAYNPGEYTQLLGPGIGAVSVNLSAQSEIVGLQQLIQSIFNVTITINTTITDINTTVNNIQTIVDIINTTTQDTNSIVKQINNTASSLINTTNTLLNNSQILVSNTNNISEQLDCDTISDSPICDKVALINQSVVQLLNLTLDLNNTAANLNITVIENINVSSINLTVNLDLGPLVADLKELKTFVNCTAVGQSNNSLCNTLDYIENITFSMNSTAQNIFNLTQYFNTSVFGNLTFQDVLDSMNNITVDTSGVLTELQQLREFDEELVFLVTDSFGLQQQAKVEFLRGDMQSAADTLESANKKLEEAAQKLRSQREDLGPSVTETDFEKTHFSLIIVAIMVIAVIALYAVSRRKKDRGRW